MIFRNRELKRCLAAWTLVLAVAVAAAGAALGSAGALVAAACCIAAALPFAVLTWWRYRRIRQLSAHVDAVLHGERELDLAHMEEGELAVLTSELDKMVTRLNLTADELAAERQALADALADISHQIKTPLTSLSLTCELVRRDLSADGAHPAEVERLRTIQTLLMRVERLVGTLLKLARLDAGVIHLERATVTLGELVDTAAEPLAIAFDIAGVELVRDVEPDASFAGDASWSAEALTNILKNCMEHTPAGGTVTVHGHEDALACRIVVEDTGPGIAPEDLPHVFERFWRGHDATSEVNPAGVGIGLSLAQSLVAAQDGVLTAGNVTDETGAVRGARFAITFFKTVV